MAVAQCHPTLSPGKCVSPFGAAVPGTLLGLQGTLVFISTLPYALSERNYGSTALEFNPFRWLPTASVNGHTNGSSAFAPVGPSACDASSDKAAAATTTGATVHVSAPEPTIFLMGPRDW